MRDVRAARVEGDGRALQGRQECEVQRSAELRRLRAEEGGPEAETGRRVAVVWMRVAHPAAFQRAVDGAVILGKEIMEHANGENDDERDDGGPFHRKEIIPYK